MDASISSISQCLNFSLNLITFVPVELTKPLHNNGKTSITPSRQFIAMMCFDSQSRMACSIFSQVSCASLPVEKSKPPIAFGASNGFQKDSPLMGCILIQYLLMLRFSRFREVSPMTSHRCWNNY
jgi:hypothetical protein